MVSQMRISRESRGHEKRNWNNRRTPTALIGLWKCCPAYGVLLHGSSGKWGYWELGNSFETNGTAKMKQQYGGNILSESCLLLPVFLLWNLNVTCSAKVCVLKKMFLTRFLLILKGCQNDRNWCTALQSVHEQQPLWSGLQRPSLVRWLFSIHQSGPLSFHKNNIGCLRRCYSCACGRLWTHIRRSMAMPHPAVVAKARRATPRSHHR